MKSLTLFRRITGGCQFLSLHDIEFVARSRGCRYKTGLLHMTWLLGQYAENRMSNLVEKSKLVRLTIVTDEKIDRRARY